MGGGHELQPRSERPVWTVAFKRKMVERLTYRHRHAHERDQITESFWSLDGVLLWLLVMPSLGASQSKSHHTVARAEFLQLGSNVDNHTAFNG